MKWNGPDYARGLTRWLIGLGSREIFEANPPVEFRTMEI